VLISGVISGILSGVKLTWSLRVGAGEDGNKEIWSTGGRDDSISNNSLLSMLFKHDKSFRTSSRILFDRLSMQGSTETISLSGKTGSAQGDLLLDEEEER
jgi:hypothetical protein